MQNIIFLFADVSTNTHKDSHGTYGKRKASHGRPLETFKRLQFAIEAEKLKEKVSVQNISQQTERSKINPVHSLEEEQVIDRAHVYSRHLKKDNLCALVHCYLVNKAIPMSELPNSATPFNCVPQTSPSFGSVPFLD